MDFTPEEAARLQREWTTRAELCKRVRQSEISERVQRAKQAALSVVVTWSVVFAVSACIVSRILPLPQMQPAKTTSAAHKIQPFDASYRTAAQDNTQSFRF